MRLPQEHFQIFTVFFAIGCIVGTVYGLVNGVSNKNVPRLYSK